MNNIHPLFADIFRAHGVGVVAEQMATQADHNLVRNRSLRERTAQHLTDAISPPPSGPHPAPVTPSPQPVTGALSSYRPAKAPNGRALRALYNSFFAPRFDALERYGQPADPDPTLAEVVEAGKQTAHWHMNEAKRFEGNPAEEWLVRYHRIRGELIAQTIAPLDALLPQPAEEPDA